MKARRLICPDINLIEVEDFDVGDIPDDGVLVENEYTAISIGTELYNFTHGAEPSHRSRFPRTTGYCNCGRVIEVGAAIEAITPGDRVAGEGIHASHDILRRNYCKVPQNTSAREAAFMVMCAIAQHGIRIAEIQLGESVAVLGMGLVGQLAASLARLAGAVPVIAMDVDTFRLDIARKRRIDHCLNPDEVDNLPAAVRDLCEDDGANVVIEATGIPSVYPTAMKLVCIAGRLIALGSPRGRVEMDLLSELHLREISIRGAIQPRTPEQDHMYYHWTKDRDRRLMLRLMSEGRLPVADLITHEAAPEQCAEIYHMLAQPEPGALGVVFKWS